MPKFTQMHSSKFLKKEDAPQPILLTVTGFREENVALQGDPEEKKWIAYFAETERGLVMNSTNLQLMQLATGCEDTEQAIGKKVVLYTDPTIQMAGRIVGGLRIRAPKARPIAPAVPATPVPPPALPQSSALPAEEEDDVPF